jgi:hypothetical protein
LFNLRISCTSLCCCRSFVCSELLASALLDLLGANALLLLLCYMLRLCGRSSTSELLASALLDLLGAALPASPGNQAALHELGVTGQLLALLRTPSSSPGLGLGTIQVRRLTVYD